MLAFFPTRRGIKNFEVIASDVCELPFPDNNFDAITYRMGFMFFPDLLLAAKEMVRVLKSGGRIAATVWSEPEKICGLALLWVLLIIICIWPLLLRNHQDYFVALNMA
jgi:ubiquinone/menaquinone biosynthesis C-methylase UbiE